MTSDFKSINDYIAHQPERNIPVLEKIRQIIKEEVPDALENISYQMPTFKYFGVLVYFAGFKNHIGLYALPSGNEHFQKELAKYKTGKGSIQFPLNTRGKGEQGEAKAIPYDLIRKIVQFRVEENKLKIK